MLRYCAGMFVGNNHRYRSIFSTTGFLVNCADVNNRIIDRHFLYFFERHIYLTIDAYVNIKMKNSSQIFFLFLLFLQQVGVAYLKYNAALEKIMMFKKNPKIMMKLNDRAQCRLNSVVGREQRSLAPDRASKYILLNRNLMCKSWPN